MVESIGGGSGLGGESSRRLGLNASFVSRVRLGRSYRESHPALRAFGSLVLEIADFRATEGTGSYPAARALGVPAADRLSAGEKRLVAMRVVKVRTGFTPDGYSAAMIPSESGLLSIIFAVPASAWKVAETVS
jgi:hypothetical protein